MGCGEERGTTGSQRLMVGQRSRAQVYEDVREIQMQRQTVGFETGMGRRGRERIGDVSLGAHGYKDVAARR